MSFDVVELIKEMDFKDTKLQFGLQCAPVIAGIKASNLFTLQVHRMNEFLDIVNDSDLSYTLLYLGKGRAVYLVYQAAALFSYLEIPKVKRAFQDFGYQNSDFLHILPVFRRKYEAYMKGSGDFPHELGLLLEYPLEDVLGFIEHRGKNFLYSGYWKVYEEKEKKMKIFKRYEAIQTEIATFLSKRSDIRDIIAFYRGGNQNIEKPKKLKVAAG